MDIPVRSPHGYLTTHVDDLDADLSQLRWAMAGGKGKIGKYAARAQGRQTIYLHRVIAHRMGLIDKVAGEGRSTASIDHIDGDKLNNRRSNLKLKTRSQQMLNGNDRLRANNRSGYRGVSEARPGRPKPWMAYVQVNGRSKNLGWYASVEEAAAARARWDAGHGDAS